MAHRVTQRAEGDLDDIWLHVARENSSVEIADRLIDTITNRFLTLARFPYMGRSRAEHFGAGYRSLPVGEYAIVYCLEGEDVLVLRVVQSRRQLDALLGH